MAIRALWIECCLLLGLSAIGLFEGVRLIGKVQVKGEPVGPGWYVVFVTSAMCVCVLIYSVKGLMKLMRERSQQTHGKPGEEKNPSLFSWGAILPVAVFATYIFLLPILGYVGSTAFFFLLALRTFGEKSWVRCILISIVFTAGFYAGFVRVAEVVLP